MTNGVKSSHANSKRALKRRSLLTKYKKEDYDQLVSGLSTRFGFQVDKIHDDINELFVDADVPIARALFARDQGLIVLSFHIVTPSVEAIQIFDYARSLLMYIALGENYYVDRNGELAVGQDAHMYYEADVENHYVNRLEDIKKAEEEYVPDFPVILHIPYPLYEATHPLSKEQDANYRKRLALFKGKEIN